MLKSDNKTRTESRKGEPKDERLVLRRRPVAELTGDQMEDVVGGHDCPTAHDPTCAATCRATCPVTCDGYTCRTCQECETEDVPSCNIGC